MTQSDKDFITRVQVAQLVTSDPYADDFYAQVFASIREQRVAANGVAAGNVSAQGRTHSRAPHRRENAIQRMQAQVERLVNNMKNRELSKESGSKRCLSISKCLFNEIRFSYQYYIAECPRKDFWKEL
jgi:DNA topoisomerase 2-associated protein PAT1